MQQSVARSARPPIDVTNQKTKDRIRRLQLHGVAVVTSSHSLRPRCQQATSCSGIFPTLLSQYARSAPWRRRPPSSCAGPPSTRKLWDRAPSPTRSKTSWMASGRPLLRRSRSPIPSIVTPIRSLPFRTRSRPRWGPLSPLCARSPRVDSTTRSRTPSATFSTERSRER